MLLISCDQFESDVCGFLPNRATFSAKKPTKDEQEQNLYSCVERWAAKLARSPQDSATEVALAAVAVCENELIIYNAATGQEATGPLTTIDFGPKNYEEFWVNRARFIAVQTRAGDCYPDA
jgi:hypothetical protein